MSMTDPVADMLTRIRNIVRIRGGNVKIPYSKLKFQLAKIMEAEGYLKSVQIPEEDFIKEFTVEIRYLSDNRPVITDLQRISKPGLRVYRGSKNIPRILGNLGIAILSTPLGLMTDAEARKKKVGGELLCKIW